MSILVSYAKVALSKESVVFGEDKVKNFLGLTNIRHGLGIFNGKSMKYIQDRFWDYLMTGQF